MMMRETLVPMTPLRLPQAIHKLRFFLLPKHIPPTRARFAVANHDASVSAHGIHAPQRAGCGSRYCNAGHEWQGCVFKSSSSPGGSQPPPGPSFFAPRACRAGHSDTAACRTGPHSAFRFSWLQLRNSDWCPSRCATRGFASNGVGRAVGGRHTYPHQASLG